MQRSRQHHNIPWFSKPGFWMAAVSVLLLSMAGQSFGSSTGVRIDLQPRAMVDRDPVLLADIATLHGSDAAMVAKLASLVVGRAPLPGKTRKIDAAYVALRLKQRGIPKGQVTLNRTAETTMVRSSTHIGREEIQAAVRDALHDRDLFQGRHGIIKDILVPKDITAPTGDISYKVKFPENRSVASTIPVSVSVFVDGVYYRKVWATLKAEVLQEVVVLKHAMRRHQRITAENIKRISINLADVPQNAITADQDIFGKRVTKSLLPGTVLRTDTIELPPLIKRGDVVILKAASEVLQVTALGQAKSNGQQGERIKIVNIDTKKELYGYVVDAKTVRIVF